MKAQIIISSPAFKEELMILTLIWIFYKLLFPPSQPVCWRKSFLTAHHYTVLRGYSLF